MIIKKIQKMNMRSQTFSSLCLIFLVSLVKINVYSQECLILHEGKFKYATEKGDVKVEIKGEDHTEWHNKGKYFIKSKIVWVNDCEYNMTMTEITIPNFPYGPGDVMNVRINKVTGKDIYYTSTVKGISWEGKLTKIE